jgi:hypothetical protein
MGGRSTGSMTSTRSLILFENNSMTSRSLSFPPQSFSAQYNWLPDWAPT